MKHLLLFAGITALIGLSGCASNKAAHDYAGTLSTVATSYQQQVAAKVKAEEESYRQLGLIYDQAIQDNAYGTLDLERFERSQKLTDDVLYGGAHRITPSQLTEALRAYGDLDFQTMKQQLGAEQAAHLHLLSGLQNLEFDLKNIGSVAESVGQNGTPGVTDGNGHGSLLCHNGTPAGPDDEFFALARDLQRHPGRTASGHHMFRRIPVHFRL